MKSILVLSTAMFGTRPSAANAHAPACSCRHPKRAERIPYLPASITINKRLPMIFSPDPSGAFVASIAENEILIRRTMDGQVKRVIRIPQVYAAAAKNIVWDELSDEEMRFVVTGHRSNVLCVCFDLSDERESLLYVPAPTSPRAQWISHQTSSAQFIRLATQSDLPHVAQIWNSNECEWVFEWPKSEFLHMEPIGAFALMWRTGGRDMITIVGANFVPSPHTVILPTIDASCIALSPSKLMFAVGDSSGTYLVGQDVFAQVEIPASKLLWVGSPGVIICVVHNCTVHILSESLRPLCALDLAFSGTAAVLVPGSEPTYKHIERRIETPESVEICASDDGSFLAVVDTGGSVIWLWGLRDSEPRLVAVLDHGLTLAKVSWQLSNLVILFKGAPYLARWDSVVGPTVITYPYDEAVCGAKIGPHEVFIWSKTGFSSTNDGSNLTSSTTVDMPETNMLQGPLQDVLACDYRLNQARDAPYVPVGRLFDNYNIATSGNSYDGYDYEIMSSPTNDTFYHKKLRKLPAPSRC